MLGAAAFGSLLGAAVTKRTAARIGAAWAYTAGCLLFTGLLGGLLGATAGLRPALWVATLGGTAGAALVLLTTLPRYRLPRAGL